jgi:hypothetical protein
MILVITHTVKQTSYDKHGRVLEEKGDVYVSHGVDIDTGKHIVLPGDKFSDFVHNCNRYEGEWYLK